MRAHILLGICAVCAFAFLVVRVQAQQNLPNNPSANDPVIEGTVVSTTQHTFVVRSDDGHYHLFTYASGFVANTEITRGARVHVNASAPDESGTQVAESVDVIQRANPATSAEAGAAPPPQVGKVTNQIEGEARRWHAGARIGVGFSPELFLFGVQSQIGPFFSPHFLFRPNAEFGFGELTDMFAVNFEGAYRFNTTWSHGWTPYIGLGPSLNFIHQSASSSTASFSNFTYKTGFNVFLGGQRRNTFVEMKTSLWSGQAPVLRLMIGLNF